MQKWITLDREVQAKQGNKDRPEEKNNQTKKQTPLLSKRLYALKTCNLKSICWEKARSSGGQVIMSPASEETFSRLLPWHPS